MQSLITFQYSFKVTPDLLDDYGHVNNARYLELYEAARWNILEKSDAGQSYVQMSKTGPVILEVNVRFSKELKAGEIIRIETVSRRKDNRIFYFDQIMKNEKDEICSQAVFTAAVFDLNKRKMIRADEKWLKAFGF